MQVSTFLLGDNKWRPPAHRQNAPAPDNGDGGYCLESGKLNQQQPPDNSSVSIVYIPTPLPLCVSNKNPLNKRVKGRSSLSGLGGQPKKPPPKKPPSTDKQFQNAPPHDNGDGGDCLESGKLNQQQPPDNSTVPFV